MSYSQLFIILFIVSNSIVYLNTQQYVLTTKPSRPQAALKSQFELKCEYTGDGSGKFVGWFKKNKDYDVSVNADKPGHYVVKQTDKESILTIKIFVIADSEVDEWYVKTTTPGNEEPRQCKFGSISAIPSPQGMKDNRGEILDSPNQSIRRSEDQPLSLICLIDPPDEPSIRSIRWQFSKDGHTYTDIRDRGDTHADARGNELIISSVKKYDRGYYRCTLNDISFEILLRVKDRLAALWPFIGIISVVLVLVIIILIFEKRQKLNKKSITSDDDEQDQASDLLVQNTTKSSDNDTKKRAVKA